ncbi:MAG: sugar phosphate isomerase/epimerase family protein [Chthoniobacterales bacterium]
MLALSTCWNSSRLNDGNEIVDEILALGFDTIEIGHGMRNFQLEGILKRIEKGDIRVESIHNFCPVPSDVLRPTPDYFEFTSHREDERTRAIHLAQATIKLAGGLGVKRMVLHGGRAHSVPAYKTLLREIQEKNFLSREYCDKKFAFVQQREKVSEFFLKRLKDALALILPTATEHNVRIGLENRQRYEDVPSEREILPLIKSTASPNLGYWHDFGHAQIKENMKLLDHVRWLDSAKEHLIGCHVHDVIWPDRDHRVPFAGKIDFKKLRPLLPQDAYFVWELSPSAEKETILAARKQWKELFNE